MATRTSGSFNPAIAIRSSVGVEIWTSSGLKAPYVPMSEFSRDESKYCRTFIFSPDGRYFAWANGNTVQISNCKNWKVLCSLPLPKTFYLKFSPNGTYLITWEAYAITKDNPDGSPNLHIYKSDTGVEVFSMIQKKNVDWEPSWSHDETIFALMLGGEGIFYEINVDGEFRKSEKKLGGGRNGSLSVSPDHKPPFVAFYVPGVKGSPSMCKLFKYPALEISQPLACKSFFQADRVEMMWNQRGTGLLLLTSTEVDQSNNSYYGRQALHFMNTKGDSSGVPLNKEGPIHAVSWSPKSTEFCIVYGFMPAKAAFFNLKCDITFDCGEGSRNCIHYNPFGNLVALGGFGNLRGNVEVWDVAAKKLISTLQAPDSTLLEWCDNGEIFVTATTAPRLRMGNGFKVWHYSGALLHETLWPTGQELLEVIWQKSVPNTFKEAQKISYEKIDGIQPSQPQASTQVYRPPNARGLSSTNNNDDNVSSKYHIPGLPVGYTFSNSTSTRKSKKHTRNQRDKPEKNTVIERRAPNDTTEIIIDNSINKTVSKCINEKNVQIPRHSNNKSQADLEKDKRIKIINGKLKDITRLKQRQINGEKLESNQMTKINTEKELLAELNSLKITT